MLSRSGINGSMRLSRMMSAIMTLEHSDIKNGSTHEKLHYDPYKLHFVSTPNGKYAKWNHFQCRRYSRNNECYETWLVFFVFRWLLYWSQWYHFFGVQRFSKFLRFGKNWFMIIWKYTPILDEVILQPPSCTDFELEGEIF